jgi:glycopeptide antibiotics resistance protein
VSERPTGESGTPSPDPSRGPGRPAPVLPGWLVGTAAAGYAAALVVITLLPIRWRSDLARYRNNWRPQLVPLWNMVVNLRDGDRALATLAGAAANVALFLPLGFLLPLLAPWFDRWWRSVGAGFALSAAIEWSQVAFPGVRRPDVNDVLMNTVGAALGFLAYRLLARARRGRRPPVGAVG